MSSRHWTSCATGTPGSTCNASPGAGDCAAVRDTRRGHEGSGRQVALVTGGSSGIGQAIARKLDEEGVDVAINYVGRPEGAEETKEAIEHGVNICMKQMAAAGTNPILVAADVSQEDEVRAMYRQVIEQYGRLDILISNAGIQIAEDTDKLSVADFDKVLGVNLLGVNLRGAFLWAQGAIRQFLAPRRPTAPSSST